LKQIANGVSEFLRVNSIRYFVLCIHGYCFLLKDKCKGGMFFMFYDALREH